MQLVYKIIPAAIIASGSGLTGTVGASIVSAPPELLSSSGEYSDASISDVRSSFKHKTDYIL